MIRTHRVSHRQGPRTSVLGKGDEIDPFGPKTMIISHTVSTPVFL